MEHPLETENKLLPYYSLGNFSGDCLMPRGCPGGRVTGLEGPWPSLQAQWPGFMGVSLSGRQLPALRCAPPHPGGPRLAWAASAQTLSLG